MPVTDVRKDLDALTVTIVADFPVSVERLWDAYADPRQIEQFWGPVEYPATFTRHDFFPGGHSSFTMTGPGGDVSRGFWEFLVVGAPRRFEVLDGFATADGSPDLDLPTMRMVFDFEGVGDGSRLTVTTFFNSIDELSKLLDMGMEEGTLSAMSQIDDVIADLRSFATDLPAAGQILDDTSVRVTRVVRGTLGQVWAAYHEPDLIRRWMTGPDGWSMTACDTASEPGGTYRYAWRNDADGTGFSSTGSILAIHPPRHTRFDQIMEGDGIPAGAPQVIIESTLTPVADGTLVTVVMTYPDAASRDAVLATGMVDGMEMSYQRLENTIAPE